MLSFFIGNVLNVCKSGTCETRGCVNFISFTLVHIIRIKIIIILEFEKNEVIDIATMRPNCNLNI